MIPLYQGSPQPLSTLTFFLTGTSTPENAYSNATLSSAIANPYTTDAYGYVGEIFLSRNRYKVVWKNAAGVTLKTWDPVDKDKVHTRGAGFPADPHPGQIHDNTSDGHRYEYKINSAAWLDLGTTDSVGNTASVTDVRTGTSAVLFVTPDSLATIWQRGTDIASASTLSIPATGGNVFNVTGTTTINGISSAQGGAEVEVKFAGALTLTHDATSFILPGAANITTVAGDCARFRNEAAQDASGSNWRCMGYTRSSGSPITITDLIASQANEETGSSTSTIVTPGRQHFHASALKAYAKWNASTTLAAGYNISSLTDNGTGDTTLNFTTSFSSADYDPACIMQRVATNSCGFTAIRQGTAPTAAALRVVTQDNNAVLEDPAYAAVMVAGDFL